MANLITGYAVDTNTHNGYLAPEQKYVCLTGGDCENRGALVQTGWIVSINGNVIQTVAGSTYELGAPAVDSDVASVEGAVAAISEALSRLQSGEARGYHPASLRHILAVHALTD